MMTRSTSNRWSSSTNSFNRQKTRLSAIFSLPRRSSSASFSVTPITSWTRIRSSSADQGESLQPEMDEESGMTEIGSGRSTSDSGDDGSSASISSITLSDEEDEQDTLDLPNHQIILANTTANASAITPTDYLQMSNQPVPFSDQAPNIMAPPPSPLTFMSLDPRRSSLLGILPSPARGPLSPGRISPLESEIGASMHGVYLKLPLNISRPIYEENRCTIVIEHGHKEEVFKTRERTRLYLVASDLSEESLYAIKWTIGTGQLI